MGTSFSISRVFVHGLGRVSSDVMLVSRSVLPSDVIDNAICIISSNISTILMQIEAPNHGDGIAWVQVGEVDENVIGRNGGSAIKLVRAWESFNGEWLPLEAFHSSIGEWMQFSTLFEPLPEFTYTGDSEIISDGRLGWRVKFLTSGVLVLSESRDIDLFLVGGGGGAGGGAGGGGYTSTHLNVPLLQNENYSIVVGAGGVGGMRTTETPVSTAGKASSAFGFTANGGGRGVGGSSTASRSGGAGGSGGAGAGSGGGYGGVDGADGDGPTAAGGKGQGSTTREFGESNGALYSTGGNTGISNPPLAGGANTGNGGGTYTNATPQPDGRAGGTGIVIIRNAR